jgi:threonine dehydratase
MFEYPTIADIRGAAERITPFINRTPVLASTTINRITGGDVCFKCENFQKVGAFKIRGATNAVSKLSNDQLSRGVTTHSSGNHAAAVALAAASRNAKVVVVMPRSAPGVKKEAVAGYGATIVYCDPGHQAREAAMAAVVDDTGAHFIHPYDDNDVIEGQATAALELLQQVPGLDMIITPIGGGGLISGAALATHGLSPQTRVVGVEPEGADDAFRSFRAGKLIPVDEPRSIADGLLAPLSERTLQIIGQHVENVVTVSEEQIIHAMRTMWERMKIVVEPSAALPLAAILAGRLDVSGARVGIIVSGGNVDMDRLPW